MTKIEMELRGFLSKNQILMGVQGAKPRKVMEFIHLYSVVLR